MNPGDLPPPHPERRAARDGLRLVRRAPFRGTRYRPGHARGPQVFDSLITLSMLAWIAWSVSGWLFPYAHGWRRLVLPFALGWVLLALFGLASNLRQAARARRGLGAAPSWPPRAGYLLLAVAVAALVWLGVLPALRIPPTLAQPRPWPAVFDSGYRVQLVTWRAGGAVHYRVEARCQGGTCIPLNAARVEVGGGRSFETDLCQREALSQSRRGASCEGTLALGGDAYLHAEVGRVTLYPASPVEPDTLLEGDTLP
jgi:hypothetical protein